MEKRLMTEVEKLHADLTRYRFRRRLAIDDRDVAIVDELIREAESRLAQLENAHKQAARAQLCNRRAELVGALAQRVDDGDLLLLGSVEAALAAIDTAPEDVETAARAVVSDHGEVIRLTFYSENGAGRGLELEPAHAVKLAGELLEAAASRLR